MQVLLLALALASNPTPAALDDEPTYTLTVTVDGVWGQSWIESIENALGRLEGVQSAKVGKKKTEYTVKVFEKKSVTPKMIEDCITEATYQYKGMNIEITGTVSQDGDNYVFEARGSKAKFSLKANDETKKLVGKIAVVSGKVTYDKKDAKKSPNIEVTGAKEAK